MATDIRVPTLGESVTEATIGRWFKKPGEAVKADEPLVELETDKVTLEVNAPTAGVLGDIVAKDGATVAPGAVLRDDVAEHARGRRVDLEGHLVGLELDERLVGLHRIAGLLEPAADRGL